MPLMLIFPKSGILLLRLSAYRSLRDQTRLPWVKFEELRNSLEIAPAFILLCKRHSPMYRWETEAPSAPSACLA
jgi:hypothetical protein